MARSVAHAVQNRMSFEEREKRAKSFRFFQIVFVLTYVGIVLDIVTTAMGVGKVGASYEQNPFGSVLIGSLGWFGLLAFMTVVSLVAYVSCKVLQWHGRPSWAKILNYTFLFLAALRWLAVLTAVAYLLQTR